MKRILTSAVGITLIVAAVAGLVFCTAGLYGLGQVHKRAEVALMEQLVLIDRTLAATAEGLGIVEASLDQATGTLQAVESAVRGLGTAMGGTAPTLDAVSGLLTEQLPETLAATQGTLSSLASTAQIVDDLMLAVSSIPILNIGRYNPETGLSAGIEKVAASLEEIPLSLGEAERGLAVANDSLSGLQRDISAIEDSMTQIATNLEDARAVVADYQRIVVEMQGVVTNVRDNLPEWLRWVRFGLSLVLIWLGIAQLGLLTQGWELVMRGTAPVPRPQPEPNPEAEPPGDDLWDLPHLPENQGDKV